MQENKEKLQKQCEKRRQRSEMTNDIISKLRRKKQYIQNIQRKECIKNEIIAA